MLSVLGCGCAAEAHGSRSADAHTATMRAPTAQLTLEGCGAALREHQCAGRGTALACIVCARGSSWLGSACSPELLDSACSSSFAAPSPPSMQPEKPLYCRKESACRWRVLPGVALHPFIDRGSVGIPSERAADLPQVEPSLNRPMTTSLSPSSHT